MDILGRIKDRIKGDSSGLDHRPLDSWPSFNIGKILTKRTIRLSSWITRASGKATKEIENVDFLWTSCSKVCKFYAWQSDNFQDRFFSILCVCSWLYECTSIQIVNNNARVYDPPVHNYWTHELYIMQIRLRYTYIFQATPPVDNNEGDWEQSNVRQTWWFVSLSYYN